MKKKTIAKLIAAITSVIVVVAFALAVIPASRDELHWQWASHIDNAKSYASYLQTWPIGRHASDAQAQYDDRGWADALSCNTVQGYENYIREHRGAKHVDEAKDRIVDLEFQRAFAHNSSTALQAVVTRFPNSRHVADAEQKLVLLEEEAWKISRQSHTSASYKEYLIKYSNGNYAKEAFTRMQILNFQSGFKVKKEFTDVDVQNYMEKLSNEKYSTQLTHPIEYYLVSGDYHGTPRKSKVVVIPSPDQKACYLNLEASNLTITAVYISSRATRALFDYKLPPTMTHNGFSGPGLEIYLPSQQIVQFKNFLSTFSIFYRDLNTRNKREITDPSDFATKDYLGVVIPDLVSGSDQQATPYPHYGRTFIIKDNGFKLVPKFQIDFKVDGVNGKPFEQISNYKQALALKTFLKIAASN